MAPKAPEIQVLTKTELQEDWFTQSDLGASSDSVGLAINLDGNGRLVVSFMKDGSVKSAHRNLDADGNALHTWSIEDTAFPTSTTAKFLDSMLAPNGHTFLAAVASDRNIYVLDCSSRFSKWACCTNDTGKTPEKVVIFTNKKNVLKLAVPMSDGSVYILDPVENRWLKDQALPAVSTSLSDFRVGSAFTQTSERDKSFWGYVISGGVWGSNLKPGVITVAADQSIPISRAIHAGSYTSLAYVAVAGNMPGTTPLIFGIDDSGKATYFQADGKGNFNTQFPFGESRKFKYLDAIFRVGSGIDGNRVEWIDLYALDKSGNVLHTRNASYDTGRKLSVKRLSNGDIYVPKWESPTVISSKAVQSFDLTSESAGAGHAHLVTLSSDVTNSLLDCHIQDMASTTWITIPITTYDHKVPKILKRNIYYVEMTVLKNGAPAPGLTIKVTSPEYCQLDINGVTTSVSKGRIFATTTNVRGQICLTIPTSESLGCPVPSVWVEGMHADEWIDVQPTGNIQKRFAAITVQDLKDAKDQTDGSKIFGSLTNDELDFVKSSLNEIGSAFSSSPKVATKGSGENKAQHLEESGVTWNRYLHAQVPKEISSCRKSVDGHMGLISHPSFKKSFRLCLRPTPSFEVIQDASPHVGATLLEEITCSWGDFWSQVSNGWAEITHVFLTPIQKGVETAITAVVDGVKKIWNGVTHFVNQAFNVIKEVFATVKVGIGKVFNWLAYIFDWDDIKATAIAFREHASDAIDSAKKYISDTAASSIQQFFKDAKSWLNSNIGTALDEAKKRKISEVDRPDSDPSHQLPSSSSWLMNKVNNSSQSVAMNQVTSSNDLFTSTVQTFVNKLQEVGISADLSNALTAASDFFSKLTSRDAMDQLTFKDFAEVFKNIIFLLIDLADATIETVLVVIGHALDMLKKTLDTPIDIPLISKIFKDVVGLDLTLFNLIMLPVAVPSTILYKIMAGEAPFPSSTKSKSNKHKLILKAVPNKPKTPEKDPVAIWTMVFTLWYGAVDTLVDFYDGFKTGSNPVGLFFTWTSILISFVALGVLTKLSPPTNSRTTFALHANQICLGVLTMNVFFTSVLNRRFEVPAGTDKVMDVMGTLIPSIYGIASFASGIWHIVNIVSGTETGYGKDWWSVLGELANAIPGIAKLAKFFKDPVISVAAVVIIDAVGYLGASYAFWEAAKIN